VAGAGLRDTRRRIRSVEATKKITRAMELIAASRIPKAQARVNASKPYTAKLIEVIENVGGASGSTSHPLLERRELRTVGIVVVSSDRGLAGAYATNVIRLAERRLVEHRRNGIEVDLFVVGKKAQSYFRYRGWSIRGTYLGVTDTPGYGDARAIANAIMDAYGSADIDAVEAFYTRFQSALTQTPVAVELLPITPAAAPRRRAGRRLFLRALSGGHPRPITAPLRGGDRFQHAAGGVRVGALGATSGDEGRNRQCRGVDQAPDRPGQPGPSGRNHHCHHRDRRRRGSTQRVIHATMKERAHV
jgi:ATP synthase F1 gamma subunit